ncbi:MAG: hypothetical protein E7420_04170 [Ruminococcaceae bacterium]|nr:hypothetical protein [Oscillospiraceae bacterium]
MITKLKKFRDSLSEKTKKYVYVGTALIVFLAACFLPLAFSGRSGINYENTSENAVLFVKYINNEKYVKSKINNKPSNSQVKFCNEIFDELLSSCILDKSSRKVLNEGCEFITVTYENETIELCRMWLQDQGDWTNWVDVYIDAETGFIYYMYVSGICVYNNSQYLNALETAPDCKSIASIVAAESGYNLELVNWSGKSEDTAKVFTRIGGESLVWNINCSYHPGSIIDIQISVA